MRIRLLPVFILLFTGGASARFSEDDISDSWLQDCHRKYQGIETITTDVAIVGGGCSGTYAAIKLRDMNYRVTLIEQKDRLGGHTGTYTDSASGTPVDYGVIIFHDLEIVRRYFDRFDISLTKVPLLAGETHYFDFTTGKRVNYAPQNLPAALEAYVSKVARYAYLEEGFDIPYPVPEDLLLPFGEFARKYNLDDMVMTAFTFGQGLGDFLQLPTIYVMKNFGLDYVRNVREGFLMTAKGNTSELYGRAQSELGQDVHLQSTVLSTSRHHKSPTGHSVRLLVQTQSGPRFIRAKQLLLTIPPTLTNLQPFDIDSREEALFSRFRYSYYLTGLLNNSGLLEKATVHNADSNRPFALPALPSIYIFSSTRVPGVVGVKYGAPIGSTRTSAEDVTNAVLTTLQRLREAGDAQFSAFNNVEPTWLAFADHSPFEMIVSVEDIRKGFYKDLYALQGYRDVWWTGAAWHTYDATLLWQFTETVVNRLVERL